MSTNPFKIGDRVRLNRLGKSIHANSVHGLVVTVLALDGSYVVVNWKEAGHDYYGREHVSAANLESWRPVGYKAGSAQFEKVDDAIEYATVVATSRGVAVPVTPIY